MTRWKLAVVLAASLAVQTTVSFGAQVLGPLAPALRTDLGLSSGDIGIMLSGFYLGAILLMLPSGVAADRIGPRWLFLLGSACIFIALWAASVSSSFAILVACMFFAGVGNAVSLPSTTRAIMDWFTASGGRATAMSIKQTGVALAGMIVAIVVPLVVGPLGWRGTLWAVGVLTFALCGISALVYPRGTNPEAVGHKRHAARRELPAQPRAVRFQLTAIGAYTFAIAGVQLSFQSFFILFLREQMHYPLALAGVLLALAQGCGVTARIGWSVVSDGLLRNNRRPALTAIGAVALAATLGLAFSSPQTPLPAIVLFAMMFGLSAIGWNGIIMVFVAESAGIERTGTAASVNLIASYVAIFAVPPVFGTIVDLTHGFRAGFEMLAVLVAFTMLFVIPMRERIRESLA